MELQFLPSKQHNFNVKELGKKAISIPSDQTTISEGLGRKELKILWETNNVTIMYKFKFYCLIGRYESTVYLYYYEYFIQIFSLHEK